MFAGVAQFPRAGVGVGHDFGDVDDFRLWHAILAFEVRQHQQFFHQLAHALGMRAHLRQRRAPGRRRQIGLRFEVLEVAAKHSDRRAQLMGHVGDEIAADFISAMQLRDVARDQQLLIAAIGREQQAQIALGLGRTLDFDGLIFARLFNEGAQRRQAHEVGDALADVFGPTYAEVAACRGVGPAHLVACIEHHGGVGQGAGRLLKLFEIGGELFLALLVAFAQIVDFERQFFKGAGRFGRLVSLVIAQPAQQPFEFGMQPNNVADRSEQQAPLGAAAQGADQQGGEKQCGKAPSIALLHSEASAVRIGQDYRTFGHVDEAVAVKAVAGPNRSTPKSGNRRCGRFGYGRRRRTARAACAGAGCARPRSAPRCRHDGPIHYQAADFSYKPAPDE